MLGATTFSTTAFRRTTLVRIELCRLRLIIFSPAKLIMLLIVVWLIRNSDTCQYFYNTDTKKILSNSKQNITNLGSGGIIWYWQYIKYCHQYNTSTAMVFSRHGTACYVCQVLSWYQFWWFTENLWFRFRIGPIIMT